VSSATSTGPVSKIAGATCPEYTISPSLAGKYISVVETASAVGHANGTAQIAAGLVTDSQFVVTKTPKVTHSGNFYTVSAGGFSPAAPASEEEAQWYYTDNNDINPTIGLTGPVGVAEDISSYGPIGAHWYVQVSATDPGTFAKTTSPAVLVKKGDFTPSGSTDLTASKVAWPTTAPAISWTIGSPTVTYPVAIQIRNQLEVDLGIHWWHGRILHAARD
jgi:hypothetical protein